MNKEQKLKDLVDFFNVLIKHNDIEKIEFVNDLLNDKKDGEFLIKSLSEKAHDLFISVNPNPIYGVEKLKEFASSGLNSTFTNLASFQIKDQYTIEELGDFSYEFNGIEIQDMNEIAEFIFKSLLENKNPEKIEILNELLKTSVVTAHNQLRFTEFAKNELLNLKYNNEYNPKFSIKVLEELKDLGLNPKIVKMIDNEFEILFSWDGIGEYSDVKEEFFKIQKDLNDAELMQEFLSQSKTTYNKIICDVSDLILDLDNYSIKDILVSELENPEIMNEFDSKVANINSIINEKFTNSQIKSVVENVNSNILENNINKELFLKKLDSLEVSDIIIKNLNGIETLKPEIKQIPQTAVKKSAQNKQMELDI